MKTTYPSILAILVAATIIGMVTIGIQQASAPRDCAKCGAFKKLTKEFQKDAIEALKNGDTDSVRAMLDQYEVDVLKLLATQ